MMKSELPEASVSAFVLCLALLCPGLAAGETKPKRIKTSLHVVGDWWNVAGIASGAGTGAIDLEAGKTYELKGLKGWTAQLIVSDEGTVSLGEVAGGPMVAETPEARILPRRAGGPGQVVSVVLPSQEKVTLDLHPAYGAYTVAGYPMKWTGLRHVFLPPGRYRVTGDMGWSFDLVVTREGAGVAGRAAGPHGRGLLDLSARGYSVGLGPPRATRIILAIPRSAGEYEIAGLLEKGSGNRAAWLASGEYTVKGEQWSVALAVGDDHLEGAAFAGGAPNDVTLKAQRDAAGPHVVRWEAATPGVAPVEEPALYAFVQLGRRVFRRGETARLSIVVKTPAALTEQLTLRAISTDAGRQDAIELLSTDWKAPAPGRTRTFDIDTAALVPGEYDLLASLGDLGSNAIHVVIVRGENERTTHFAICSYTHADPSFEENNLFNVDQPKYCGPRLLGPRVDEKSQAAYSSAWSNPSGRPYELNQNIPDNQKFLEELTLHNVDAMLQYGCDPQYFHSGTCPADPHIRRAVARGGGLIVQRARHFDSFRALVIGEEVAWPRARGVRLGDARRQAEDACPYCEQDFEQQTGRPVPPTPDDAELFRTWMIYKQTQLANFFDYVARRSEQIMPGIEINAQQGNLSFYTADGGYPPITNEPLSLLSAHWYPDLHGSLTAVLGHEFVRMGPRHIPYWPKVWTTNLKWTWDWMTGEEARHEVYLAVSRQAEGIDHFAGFALANTPGFAELIGGEVHPNLTRNGDFLLQLRRNTAAEVAVFYSFEEQHRDCFAGEGDLYKQARRHVETVALAFFSLVRNHFQASIVSEEDILAGSLEGRPAVLIAGITRMRPEIKSRIEAYAAAGGKVFVDAETAVEVRGAERIDCRFDLMWRAEVESTWPSDDKLYNSETLPAIRESFGRIVPRPAVAQSPLTILTRLKGGQGDYVWVINDNVAMGNASPEGEGFKALPLQDTVTLPPAAAIYEVFSGRKTDGPVVDLDLAPGDARLFACLPAAPARIDVSVEAQDVAARGALAWRADVADAENKPIRAPIPIQVSVLDPSGKELATLYRSTLADEPASGTYVLPADAPAGAWSVRVTSLLGGASSAVVLEGAAPRPAAGFIAELGDLMPVADAHAIKKTVAAADALYVAIGDVEYARQAGAVAAALRNIRKKADVRLADELRYRELDRMFGYGMFRKWADTVGGPQTALDRPCIAIGKPTDNPFIADVMLRSEILDQLVTPDYPGPGKGVVLHTWMTFSYVHNTIIVSGSDSTGITKAAAKLIELVSQ